MGIIVNEETRVIVQGITGTQGRFHTSRMFDYGTNIVAGVTPGKGSSTLFNVPVYATHNPILGFVTASYEKVLAARLNPAHASPDTA